MDVFKTNFYGGNILYASGRVYETTTKSAIIMLDRVYVKKKIEVGFVVRVYE